MKKTALFEIGIEELPARFIQTTEHELKNQTKKWLENNRLTYDTIESFSTPRRIAVRINNLADAQETIKETLRGPSVKIGKDEAGEWTKAAIGFAKGQGKSVDDLYEKKIKDEKYLFVDSIIEGDKTENILHSFHEVIESLPIQAQMNWNDYEFRFIRPIRWLVGLYGETVIPFSIAEVRSSNKTYGHRFLGEEITLKTPEQYEDILYKESVIVNRFKRKEMIKSQIQALEKENDFDVLLDKDLLNEVTDLVEYPTAFVGKFGASFLEIPEEILITSMKEHQRYFPVYKNNRLQPYFIGVRNGKADYIENVRLGNERVLQARLNDAAFFYKQDLQLNIDHLVKRLKNVVFQEKLGSYYDKTKRVQTLALSLENELNLELKKEDIKRAAYISKFDLLTNVVNEFTELQGVIGSYYAEYFGESTCVIEALKEQYLPESSAGKLPSSTLGALLAVSDKIDTIVGCIMVDLIPTGSQDPYGLRRNIIGILRILQEKNWDITIEQLFALAIEQYPTSIINNKEKINQFLHQRVNNFLEGLSIEHDVIKAVTAKSFGQLNYLIKKAKTLSKARKEESFKKVSEALVRVSNLVKDVTNLPKVNEALFETSSEAKLYEKLLSIKELFIKSNEEKEAEDALNHLADLTDEIEQFFENNMVMTDDNSLRNNRLSLLKEIDSLIQSYADLRLIEWRQERV